MARRFWGSINLDEIKTAINSGITPFEGKKGKYATVSVWVEDQPDKFGNSLSITMYNKDKKETFYLGNLKEEEVAAQKASEPSKDSDLPF